MELFFTSDLHLGHVRCATEFRGFASVAEHNATIVERWNDTVGDDDIVYIVGDACMGKLDESLAVAKTLRGTKLLVPGNHDRMHPAYHHKGSPEKAVKEREKYKQRYFDEGGFFTMARQMQFDDFLTGGRYFTVCHFPFGGEDHEGYEEARYPEYSPEDTGDNLLIHGHIHDLRRESLDKRQVNVGVDVWDFTPVHIERIIEVMGW